MNFRIKITEDLISQKTRRKRGRPRSDEVDHLSVFLDNKFVHRCKQKGCTNKTYVICQTCKISLCIACNKNCFKNFHNKIMFHNK